MADDRIPMIQQAMQDTLPGTLGIELIEVTDESVSARLEVTRAVCTTGEILHGGAIMASADTLGAYGTALNLPEGAGTTTVESKTNFFGRAAPGSRLRGESTPLHRGKRTMVWQTRITRDDGKLVALVTQTQIVLAKQPTPAENLAALFAEGDALDQQAVLAGREARLSELEQELREARSAGGDRGRPATVRA